MEGAEKILHLALGLNSPAAVDEAIEPGGSYDFDYGSGGTRVVALDKRRRK